MLAGLRNAENGLYETVESLEARIPVPLAAYCSAAITANVVLYRNSSNSILAGVLRRRLATQGRTIRVMTWSQLE